MNKRKILIAFSALWAIGFSPLKAQIQDSTEIDVNLKMLDISNVTEVYTALANNNLDTVGYLTMAGFDSISNYKTSIIHILKRCNRLTHISLFKFDKSMELRSIMWEFLDAVRFPEKVIWIDFSSDSCTKLEQKVIIKYSNLRVITLQGNGITNLIPILEVTSKLPKLSDLVLWSNPITAIPDDPLLYGNLNAISLNWTPIKSLPCEVLLRSKMTHYSLFNTKITTIPRCVERNKMCVTFFGNAKFMRVNKHIQKKIKKRCNKK